MNTAGSGAVAQIGKSLRVKGELSGKEDIYVDGEFDGSIELSGHSMTVGPNGRLQADIKAKSVIVGGSLNGNIQASERTELRKTAVVNGDVQTRRIAIEEGAYFKGKLEILAEPNAQAAPGAAAAVSAAPPSTPPSASEQNK